MVGSATAALTAVSPAEAQAPLPEPAPTRMDVSLEINGAFRSLEVDTRTTLLDLLREHLHMTGTKKGCDHGQCGACTVIVDGQRINACLSLAVMNEGAKVTTIEGLGHPGALHAVQQAWVAHQVAQCGYCQPGQIMAAAALLAANPAPADAEIDAAMSGNLCRCGTYPRIREAVKAAAHSLKGA